MIPWRNILVQWKLDVMLQRGTAILTRSRVSVQWRVIQSLGREKLINFRVESDLAGVFEHEVVRERACYITRIRESCGSDKWCLTALNANNNNTEHYPGQLRHNLFL
jgi:hypothetical protein